MDNFEKKSDEEKKSSQDIENTQPGERLRRLLSRLDKVEDATPVPISKTPPAPEEPMTEQAMTEQPHAGEPVENGSWVTIVDGADTPGGEAVIDAPPPEEDDANAFHPTGEPDATGGWYGEVEDTDEPAATSPAAAFSQQHPTGEPQATGGWYKEVQNVQDEEEPVWNKRSENEMTNPMRVPMGTEKLRIASEEKTIPPSSLNNNDDLPKRVDEVDKFATRVGPAAFHTPVTSNTPALPVQQKPKPTARPAPDQKYSSKSRPRKAVKSKRSQAMGCVYRLAIVMLFVFVFVVVILSSIAVYQYFTILASLPEIDDLKNRASQFETTRILDRDGNELYEVLDPNAGRRTYISLDKMSPNIIAATIATEDKEFYNHPGYDPVALVRALWQNYTNQTIVSGASTITQQLARTLLFSPDERIEQSYQRKAREIVLAAEITRKYSKEEILELYLNENNYGYHAYGIEAASETYFHTNAAQLNLAQATFLAGIPQAPSVYDIFTNREQTLLRHEDVVVLMYQLSQEKDCIEVSNSVQPVCVDAALATQSLEEIKNYTFELDQNVMTHPHWVNYVRMLLEAQFDAQTIYRSGFTVYTSLDPELQEMAEQTLLQQVQALADRNVNGGALVAIQPSTGEILAMVGSPDFYNEVNSGQVNMAINPRQPGSAIKPFTYTAAFEKGWTASTLIWDVPTDFPPSGEPDDTRPPYQPVNYDSRFHGPVSVRAALANSYNIPAVKTLDFVGIYDDSNIPGADGFINFARRMGITTLNQIDYGLSLTLGGGEVTLLEMTGAYSTYANGGRYIEPVAILKIVDHEGNVVYEYDPPNGEQVIREEHAYLITSILSDNAARSPMFGTNSILNLPFPAAVKTGTTNDYRDNWTIGYTPDLAVGVWIGNPNYTPMLNTTGVSGAAPIWSQFMQQAVPVLTGGSSPAFVRPNGIVDEVVCTYSGTFPSEWCPSQVRESFAFDQPPRPKTEDLWIKANVDTWTGLKVSAQCDEYTSDDFALFVEDDWGKKWIQETNEGREWAKSLGFEEPITFAPERECRIDDPRPRILFAGIEEGQTISLNPFDIYALISATDDFKEYRLEYGLGEDPAEWKVLLEHVVTQHDPPDRIYTWDLSDVPAGLITLRIYLDSTEDTYAEKRIHLNIQVPTQTPTLTLTPSLTPTPTFTPTFTMTPTPTFTPTFTMTPTSTSTNVPPSETPSFTVVPMEN